jgi:tRNA threonylcarbamoyladenosine biosynthesis protein TsaB
MPSAPLRLLAIDSSTDQLSVALGHGGETEPVGTYRGPGAAQASASLLPVVQDLLAQAGWPLASLDAIAFGRGPGSFTGLRTACAVAQGLAYGIRRPGQENGLPVLPVDTLLALADEARHQRAQAGLAVPPLIAALLDARMDEIYLAAYAVQGTALRPLAAPVLCAPEALGEQLHQWLPEGRSLAAGDCLLAGNALAVYPDRLAALPGVRQAALPGAAALLRLAPALLAAGAAVAAHEALPLYVRDKVARTTAEREQ